MNDDRLVISNAIGHVLHQLVGRVNQSTLTLIEQMRDAAASPYDLDNRYYPWGDNCKVDRYLTTAKGNLGEVRYIATNLEYGVPGDTITIHTDKHTQVELNGDITINDTLHQVKHATFGSYGELFVSSQDIIGSPDLIAYVDHDRRLVYTILHQDILDAVGVLKENEVQSGLQSASRSTRGREVKGYYIIKEFWNQFITTLQIPDWAFERTINETT